MDPATATSAASIGGSIISGLFNQRSANKKMAFQREMSNTAWQRAMADMRVAGLNPILAAKVGPATTPGGAQANMPDLGATMNSAQSVQVQQEQTDANVQKIKEEINGIKSENVKKQAVADYLQTEEGKKIAPMLTTGDSPFNPVTSIMTWFKGETGTDDPAHKVLDTMGYGERVVRGVWRILQMSAPPGWYPELAPSGTFPEPTLTIEGM